MSSAFIDAVLMRSGDTDASVVNIHGQPVYDPVPGGSLYSGLENWSIGGDIMRAAAPWLIGGALVLSVGFVVYRSTRRHSRR
jgi:hypothetical protein